MNYRQLIITLAIFTLSLQNSKAQQSSLVLLARPMPDSIMLRWAPADYDHWLVGNKVGYVVTRTLIMQNKQLVTTAVPELLTPTPLKPAPLAQWEAPAENDRNVAIAAECIFGDGLEVETGTGNNGMVDIFNKATEQESRYGFALFAADQSVTTAKLSGLWFSDTKAKKGCNYLYQVYLSSVPEGMISDTAIYYTSVDEYMPLPAPLELRAETVNRLVSLSWDAVHQQQFFNSYYVERSFDNGKSFQRINTNPLVNTTPDGYDESQFHVFIDTIPASLSSAQYRVIGISQFGELSPPSLVVTAGARFPLKFAPRINKALSPNNETVQISWEPFTQDNAPVDGYRIWRGSKYDGSYEPLIDSIAKTQLEVTDKQPLGTGYYRLQAYNIYGNSPMSTPVMVQLIDSFPPMAPVGLKALADTTGHVHLTWTANTEADMLGYRIFRANSLVEEFAQITHTPVLINAFEDTVDLKTLTKKIYYQVMAIDNRQNQSPFSETLEVDRPDIVPPVPPYIYSTKATDKGIELRWHIGADTDLDKLVLFRAPDKSTQFATVHLAKPYIDSLYCDTTLTSNGVYAYRLMAVDRTGNEAVALQPVSVEYKKAEKESVWITPKVKIRKRKGVIELSWDGSKLATDQLMLYAIRKGNNNTWQLIGTVPNVLNNQNSYLINSLNFVSFKLKINAK